MHLDEQKLEAFAGRVVDELAAAWSVASIHLGDRLGPYRGLLAGAATADELAARTGCSTRLVAEWLAGQAASAYVVHDPASGRYVLPAEHAAVLAVERSPAYLPPQAAVLAAMVRNEERIDAAFRGDGGLPWGEQHPCLFGAVDRAYGTGYRAALVDQWIPALDGVAERLAGGGRVLDVGCGLGTATVLLAEGFPRAQVTGVDLHQPSLDEAAKRAARAGVAERTTFEAAGATTYGGGPYDLICFFDSLHDMGHPDVALSHAREQLAEGGTVLVVEPMAAATPAEPCPPPALCPASTPAPVADPVSRMFLVASATLCTPNALAQGGAGLGNQVPDSTWRELFAGAGFGHFRRAAETPTNRVFEARRAR
jgi:SAM-dependent methyltransferase